MSYRQDRAFTDYVHERVAIPKIYNVLGWQEKKISTEEADKLDIFHGIDRVFITGEGKVVTVQERFRCEEYRGYTDFTIRYKREENPFEERRKSEFFKIKADYFVYGIVNCRKDQLNSCSDFIKFVVVDMNGLRELINDGLIVIDESFSGFRCFLREDGKMVVPVKKNSDGSSSFIPIDVVLLKRLDDKVIVLQKGFLGGSV